MADRLAQLGLPENPTFEDIEKERVFRQILVDTLDKDAHDYQEQKRLEEENIRFLDEMLGINEEMLSPGGLSHDVLSPDILSPDILSPDILSPGAMSQGTPSQGSWDQTPIQPRFGGEQFGQTDVNGMGHNGGDADFNWLLDSMWQPEGVKNGECTLFLDITALQTSIETDVA
jgi:hypothetical protein